MEDEVLLMSIITLVEFKQAMTDARLKLTNKSKNLVRKQLLPYITDKSTEYNQLGEDFLSTVYLSLLEKVQGNHTDEYIKESKEKGRKIKPPQYYFEMLNKDSLYVEKYFTKAVKCQCIDRQIRWADDKDAKKKQFSESREHETKGKAAVRARSARPIGFEGSDDDWLASNASATNHTDNLEAIFGEDLEEYLSEQGLTNEEISLIKLHLSGLKYEEIALTYGPNEKADKYRKRVYKALGKLDLKVSDLAY